jgi:hypothetical protein
MFGSVRTRRLLVALTLTPLITSGCIAVGGSDNYTKPTLGKQLMDLKTARDTGAINDAEYHEARAGLLAGK